MPDVTGRAYEALTEFILLEAGYNDGPIAKSASSSRPGAPYFQYEKHAQALCHTNDAICRHALECSALSAQHSVPFGPWYDPDFFLFSPQTQPFACLHVTRWGSPSDSHRKFWRTLEDHLQYKTFFGRDFLSVSLVFAASESGTKPQLIVDKTTPTPLHGWKVAVSSALVVAFDSTIVFPIGFEPLEKFEAALPSLLPRTSSARRALYNATWSELCATSSSVRSAIGRCVGLLKRALAMGPSSRYGTHVIQHLQDICYKGRQTAIGLKSTTSRYRKGIQHAFLLGELTERFSRGSVSCEEVVTKVVSSPIRFHRSRLTTVLGLKGATSASDLAALELLLTSVPVKVSKASVTGLLIPAAGLEHLRWNDDFGIFVLALAQLPPAIRDAFPAVLARLFASYRTAQGIQSALQDLFDLSRVDRKVSYAERRYVGVRSKADFIEALCADMLTPGSSPPHQAVVADGQNWIVDILLSVFGLKRKQHVLASLTALFHKRFKDNLEHYSYCGIPDFLVNHLIQGTPVGQFFARAARMSEGQFYSAIWPVLAECIWMSSRRRVPLSHAEAVGDYRIRRARRIISQSDLDPIGRLVRDQIPSLDNGPTLQSAFTKLGALRGWGANSLTTGTSGRHTPSGSLLHIQSVFGKKHIADKTRELAARLRALEMSCNRDGTFTPAAQPLHFLVVDGDWPFEAKLNLLEAGYSGIFELAELATLASQLDDLSA